MKILVVGLNYAPEPVGAARYTTELSQWLAARGNEVRVVAAVPYYPNWRIQPRYKTKYLYTSLEKRVKVTRCRLYVPANPRLLTRLIHLGSFAAAAIAPTFQHYRWGPDLVILILPTIFCAPLVLLFSAFSGAVPVAHVQDFELDAMKGAGVGKNGAFAILAKYCESFLLKSFAYVTTISKNMCRVACDKGVHPRRVGYLPNWATQRDNLNHQRNEGLLVSLGVDPSRPVVLYCGSIGKKQGLPTAVEAAQLPELRDYQFLFCGEGAGKQAAVELAREKTSKNIFFHTVLPDDIYHSLLHSVDCHLVLQAALIRDAVLPSKLTNILAAGGNAVITAPDDTSLAQLCIAHPGLAIRVEPDSPKALAEGVRRAAHLPQPNRIALQFARENLDRDRILQEYWNHLRNL